MRTREQKGYVWRVGAWWWIRFSDTRIENGVAVRKQGLAQKLSPVMPEHRRLKRPPESVQQEQERFMDKINGSRSTPEHNVTLSDFVRNVWFPNIQNRHAASTVHFYRYYWDHVLSPRCGKDLLRDFSTPAAQGMIETIARQNPQMKKSTLHRLKSIMSAIFKLAIQQGFRPGPNPIRETSLPRAQDSAETIAYDLDAVLVMLRSVPEPSRTVIAVAAFAGLRRGEIEGLCWESYTGETLNVTRAMWRGIAGEPKSKKSKASVPVIAPLNKFLDAHRARCGNPETGIMFRTQNNTPLSMNNLLNDQIRPALEKCGQCGKGRIDHGGVEHEYQRSATLPMWSGFHAFRRGLATNLHSLGVDDLTIQRILRHSDVSVTQRCYIKTLPEQSIAAMRKLETMVDDRNIVVCNQSANDSTISEMVH